MRIGFFTDDWNEISLHPGRCSGLKLLILDDTILSSWEKIEFQKHSEGAGGNFFVKKGDCGQGRARGHSGSGFCGFPFMRDPGNIELIYKNCDVVIARGMGFGLSERLVKKGVRVILTSASDIETAAAIIAAGNMDELEL